MNSSQEPNENELNQLFNLYQKGESKNLKNFSKELLGSYPNSAQCFMYLAIGYFQESDNLKAEKFLKKSISINQNNHTAFNILGVIQQRLRKYNEAIISYNKSFELNSNDGNSLNNLSNLYRDTGKPLDSLKCINLALNKNPENISFMTNKVLTLLILEKIEEAKQIAEKIYSIDKDHIINLNSLGIINNYLNQDEDAIKYFKKAIEIKKDYNDAYLNLIDILCKCDKFTEVKDVIIALLKNYNHPKFYDKLTKTIIFRDKILKGITLLDELNNIYKNNPNLLNNLGNLHRFNNNNELAIKTLEQAIQLDQSDYSLHNDLGAIFFEEDKYDLAEKHYLKSLELKNNDAVVYHNLGNLKTAKKEMDDGIHYYQKALETNPDFYDSLYSLVRNKVTLDDKKIKYYENELKIKKQANQSIAPLALSLAENYELIGNYDKAMEYYLLGNSEISKRYNYNNELEKETFKNIKEKFSAFYQKNQLFKGNETKRPIFIVGLPRSGSTLIEQILSSHHDVYGAGEINYLHKEVMKLVKEKRRQYPDFLEFIDELDLNNISRGYIQKIDKISNNHSFITDKNLSNSMMLGLIILLFPEAKIVHSKRDPVENCFSIFSVRFSGDHIYAYDLENIANFYNLHSQMMSNWKELFPEKIYELQYENLVQDNENEVKKLLKFCNLPFDKRCLEFYKNDRPLRTESAAQVRQKIYTSSLNRSNNFKNHLKLLYDILEN